jgi:hypothetical protein
MLALRRRELGATPQLKAAYTSSLRPHTDSSAAARAGRNASLQVYYGFTEHDRQLASRDTAYASWMREMQQALLRAAPLGVT